MCRCYYYSGNTKAAWQAQRDLCQSKGGDMVVYNMHAEQVECRRGGGGGGGGGGGWGGGGGGEAGKSLL